MLKLRKNILFLSMALAIALTPCLFAQDGATETESTPAPSPFSEAISAPAPSALVPEVAPTPTAAPTPQVPDSVASSPGANAGAAKDLTWPIPADSSSINPAGKNTVTMDELIQNVAHNKISINIIWTLLCGFLIMFMQAGFALVETGLCRAKNAAHVMSTNFMIYALGMLGFWICGFGIMFGGYWNAPVPIGWQPPLGQGMALLNVEHTITLFDKPFGIAGGTGFFLNPSVFDTAVMVLFLFQMVFMDTTATIPTGSMAERWNFKNFMIYGLWVGMIPYAFFGNWVWGGGWLAQLGINFGLGHGHVDFAGGSVVHLAGGMIALAGCILIGPRIGKFDVNGNPRAIPAHDVPMVILGTFILALGWFGFNPGSTLAGTDHRIGIIAVNTMLAGAAASVATLLVVWKMFGNPDPSMMCNGLLSGLVAITASCAFVTPLAAVIIGACAGVLVVFAVIFVERGLKLDDPVGAIAVHGVCGTFGVFCVGLFANGSYGAGWNGVHTLVKGDDIKRIVNDATPATLELYSKLLSEGYKDQGVTGIFGKLFGGAYNDFSQLGAQTIGVLTCIVFVFSIAFVWFKVSDMFIPLRSKPEDEVMGLDVPEMGAEAYPDFQTTETGSPKAG
jgi:Amt family ammonium transporter